MQVDNKYPLKDIYYCAREFLVSYKFADVLKTLTNEYQEFPVEIYRKEDFISKEYLIFEFTSSYPAIDWDKSVYRKQIAGLVRGVRKLVLSKEKLIQIPDNIHIFRMQEASAYLLLTEKAKIAIDGAGIRGIEFEELEIV